MRRRTRPRARRWALGVAAAAVTALAAAPGAGVTAAAASDGGSVRVGPVALALQNTESVSPGDWLSFGVALAIATPHHPAASIRLSAIVVQLPVTCDQGPPPTIRWSFPEQNATIPSDSQGWFPTGQDGAAPSFQLIGRAPDACGGRPMSVSDRDGPGAWLQATLASSDPSDAVQVRFHGVDAYSGGDEPHNVDCGGGSNPEDGTCDAPWSPSSSARPAPQDGGPEGPSPVPANGGRPLSTLPVVTAGNSHVAGISVTTAPAPAVPSAAARTPLAATAPPSSTPPGSLVLGPVPILAPVVGNPLAPAGTAIPWYWFVVLAALDLALIIVLALRRRLPRSAG
ncbi:MAG: hypothetical protein ACYDAC_06065 [Candidatus Dormibacteria bacterium]